MISISLDEQKINQPLNFRERIVEELKIWLVIKPLQSVYKHSATQHLHQLKACPNGTVGNEVYQLLNDNNLSVIPKFENHDLKHLILGYGMTSIEEIRMQMYLLGNGNYSIFCLLFAASGILFPKEWNNFYKDYKKGKKAPSILHLYINDCMKEKTVDVKTIYNQSFQAY